MDHNGSLTPSLATSWKYIDDHTIIFKLRENVKFHNGEKFDADSVVFTINLFLDRNERVDNRFYWGPICGVKKIDDYTVQIQLSEADNLMPYRFATIGQVLPPKYYKQVGRKYFSNHPIGTGPFILDKFADQNKTLRFVSNENYWGGKPSIDVIDFIFPNSMCDAVKLLFEGELDFVPMIPGAYTLDLAKSGKINIIKSPASTSVVIMLNTKKNGILKDPRVREALRCGLNMHHIVEYGYNGNGEVSGNIAYKNDFTSAENDGSDLKRSLALLRRAGIRKNTPLNVMAMEELRLVGKMVARQLEALGFCPETRFITVEEEKRAVLYKNQLGQVPEVDMLITYCSDRFCNGIFPLLVLVDSKGTWSLTNSSELDSLLAKATASLDSAEQAGYIRKASAHVSQHNLLLPGFRPNVIYGLKKPLMYKPYANGYLYFKSLNVNKGEKMNLTGKMVAYFRANESKYPDNEQLFSDPYASLFVDDKVAEFSKQMVDAMPSLGTFLRLRTRAIDDWLKELISKGTEQVVIVGAGADCRAFRLGLENVKFYELDYPGSGEEKYTLLKQHFPEISAKNIRYLSIDLAKNGIAEILGGSDFNTNSETVFIIEGVMNYLNKADNERILRDIRKTSKKAYIIYHYCTNDFITDSTGVGELTRHRQALAANGYHSYFGIDNLSEFADNNGYKVIRDANFTELYYHYSLKETFNTDAGKHISLAVLQAK